MLSISGRGVNWVAYFCINNIELDILLNAVDTIYREERACRLRDFVVKNIFERLNPHLVEKLTHKGVLKSFKRGNEVLYTVTTRGLKAFFDIASPVYHVVARSPGLSAKDVARILSPNILFGGIHRVYSMHERLVEKILRLLSEMGYLRIVDGGYEPAGVEDRIKASIEVLNRLSSISFIRRVGEVAHSIAKAMDIPVERVDDIINGVLYAGVVVSERDPRKAVIDLLTSLKTRIELSIRNGRLLEAAAYSSLALNLIENLLRTSESRNLVSLRNKYRFMVHEILGDYFYHNLCFEASQLFYNRAVNIAREYPELARDAQRTNAKYILSRARSLASKKRYTEAVSELDRLIEYYRSIGLMRESEIALALKKEYQGEIEVLRNKTCIAYQLFEEAASIYNRLGSRYRGKAKATQCKALISRGECELLVNKNPMEAMKILEEAAKLAGQILSPHLKNAALSLYYEARARVHIEEGDLASAARDFGEASKYYETRGLLKRSLLSLARSYKFYGFHYISQNNFGEAHRYMNDSMEQYHRLLKVIDMDMDNGKKPSYYILGEALKGLLDTRAMSKLLNALNIVEENVMITPRTVDLVLNEAYDAAYYLSESAREVEYSITMELIELLKKLKERTGLRGLEETLGDIAEYIDKLHIEYINNWREPRKEAIARIVSAILVRIKNGLETITHYLEEI